MEQIKNIAQICKELGITRSFYSVFLKRFLDIFISFTGIVVLSGFLVLFYLLNLIFIGFPAIYKQPRPGKNHKIFNLYKFRSMTNKKDKDGNLLPDSQRINWYGKIIRKLSIDELPQLFNILKGDMSIVGPRPRLVKDMVFYDKDVYKYYIVRPGLTGPTQVSGRNRNTWEQVFEKDIDYIKHINFWTDCKIFFLTFFTIFQDTGETHNNTEEDKTKVKAQEYYYADYIRRIQKINTDEYNKGMDISKQLKKKDTVSYYPELHESEMAQKDKIA